MFLSGVQVRICLDSRLKHAEMTDVGSPIDLTQQAAENEPVEQRALEDPLKTFYRGNERGLLSIFQN